VERGSRSLERAIASPSVEAALCLERHDVVAYLGSGCPKELRDRADAHLAHCGACRRWVRHIDDEVLEYVGGEPTDDELARMDAHLDACSACRELVHHVLQGRANSWPGSEREVPESSTTFATGNIVSGRYRVLSFVGRGGMGEVYEAYDQLMDRRIALKTLLCSVADRPRAARRFKEEVRNAQRVGHPNVCRINDLQEHHQGVFGPALPFFTMEFIEGERLGNRLMQSALPIGQVRTIALQLLDGLKAAHARGVLHLDFKSDNVMLRRTEDGTPDAVIMDFGLSRVQGHESRLRTTDRRQFAGTLPYMSVEQLECREDLGPDSDVYSFGVVLYEMLTRVLPFDGDSLSAVLLKQLKERPAPPSRLVAELSPALDRFVLECLSSSARGRYADAGQALAALESIGAWTRAPMSTRLLQAAPLAVVGLVAVVVAATAVRQLPRSPVAPPPESAIAAPIEHVTRALEPAALVRKPSEKPAQAPGSSALPYPESAPATPARTLAAGWSEANVAQPRSAPTRPGAARAVPAATPSLAAANGVVATTPASLAAASATQSGNDALASEAPPSTQATAGAATSSAPTGEARGPGSWKPTRVPKRLSVPPPRETVAPGTLPEKTLPRETLRGETPAGQTPPSQTPPSQTPPSQTPPSQTPPSQTPPSQTPPSQSTTRGQKRP
jgi:hypothetical protein